VPTDDDRQVVLLATCAHMPDGEEWAGTNHLLPALSERGIDGRWVVWDDPAVDWSEGLVAVRATWDYERRREEFLAWSRTLPRVLNSAAVFEWNTDKAYLTQLDAAGVSVVPTVVVQRQDELLPAVAGFGPSVVKPCVGAGGRGVVVLDGTSAAEPEFGTGPWVVQPVVDSVRTEGETSVFVIDGQVVSQAQKRPAPGELRVHEMYGGTTVATPVSDEAAELARRTVEAAETILGERLDYARVDQMRLADGTLAVSELEVTEPGLYLEVLPDNAAVFAGLVLDRLRVG
jgi:glutathione synthase/RimK-type ligase-like ATP-grasp enzyme